MRRSLLILSLVLGGCSARHPAQPTPTAAAPAHEHRAPHGGALVELGEEFAHLELSWDAAEGRLLVYVLDGEAEQGVPISDPELVVEAEGVRLTLAPQANPLSGETAGNTSVYSGRAEALEGRHSWRGRLKQIMVRGRRFSDVAVQVPQGEHLHAR